MNGCLLLLIACSSGCRTGSSVASVAGFNSVPRQSEPKISQTETEVNTDSSASDAESLESKPRQANILARFLKPATVLKRKRIAIPRTDLDDEESDEEALASKSSQEFD